MTATASRYTAVAVILHWLIAAAILTLIVIGWRMMHLGPANFFLKFKLFQLHKSIGITVLALSLARLAWRLGHPALPAPTGTPLWQARAASLTHAAFYVLMIGMPLTGWFIVSISTLHLPTVLYGLVHLPDLPVRGIITNHAGAEKIGDAVHVTGALVLVALLLLHVAAALKHQFVDRDGVLSRMIPFLRYAVPAVLALAATAPAHAASWTVDPAKSTLGFTGTQSGMSFTGHFASFTATIDFDPAKPEAGHALVDIDMTSAATGDEQRDSALPQAEWFDISDFPHAKFEATKFQALGGDRYAAIGTLSIRNVSKPVTLPFTLDITNGIAAVKGKLDLTRTDYGVGQGDWSVGTYVALDVTVTVDLVASGKQ